MSAIDDLCAEVDETKGSVESPSDPYSAIKALNWSTLRNMAVSPLLYKYRLARPQPRTATLTVGTAIHCALLEPDKFAGTRRGKAWDEWQEEHPGVESLKPAEAERVRLSAAAVRGHRVASRLLDGCRVEESTTWTDPDTGLACKGRLDAIAPHYVVDLKSTRDPSPRAFERSASDMLYHGQLGFYADGAVVSGKVTGCAPPYIIAVQSAEPYDCAVYQLTPETLAAGRALYRSLMRRLQQCIEADFWPGVCPDLEQLELPPWAQGQTVSTEDEF